ncbi:5'-nucleotidase /3'-nucleotidase /exopolyphosphatase [Faunimonas pinastri]|uniref:5'-nucleotidase SurE n=1 Tax=Faunimonas pinastri TaxID=1855383 RepID=A0A1H9CS05_9HYPH|nr:5'/3'-nucleotidase SurE [Faunimonas pinastri]SEQ03944.1 5'-nucleotidase /3'-nucleotidase /exopolyphosphatase [Faunimonas pinastri]
MRILVTNDDGIDAPGLEVAERIARSLSDDVWVVAPETDQSGSAHSLTLSDPLRLRKLGDTRFAVRGTPTDCVIMGVKVVLGGKPDLVISGVNRGQNVADDVTYSGTIAGAMEGTLLGIPSVALSQAFGPETRGNPHWANAESHAPRIIRSLLDGPRHEGRLYNINFPDCPAAAVAGVAVTRQGKRKPDWVRVEQRADGRGLPYYWLGFGRQHEEPPEDTDLAALAERRISVTPLALDLTDNSARESLAGIFS